MGVRYYTITNLNKNVQNNSRLLRYDTNQPIFLQNDIICAVIVDEIGLFRFVWNNTETIFLRNPILSLHYWGADQCKWDQGVHIYVCI